jgi:hypothetical protein
MSKNNKNTQDNSMFLYTALIFAVALILIIMSFFGQTNLTKLRNNHAEWTQEPQTTQTAEPTQSPSVELDDEFAKMVNTVSTLDEENKDLKMKAETSDILFEANAYLQNADLENAKIAIEKIDVNVLTDNQKVLYNQIISKINEGKE